MMSIEVDTRQLDAALARFGERAADGRTPLKRFYAVFKARCPQAIGQVRATGGMYRGKAFPKLADQYTRKTDGVTVPAWGGVPRVAKGFRKATKWSDTQRRGVSTGERMAKVGGNVSGRLRGDGQRVKASSPQMNATGRLLKRLFPQRADITRQRLQLGADAPDYYESLAKERPVLFFTPEDQAELNRQAEVYFGELAKEFNGAK